MILTKRKKFLVDSLQYRLLLINLTYFVAVILVFAAAVFAPSILALNSESWELKQAAAAQFLFLHARLWPAVTVLFVLLVAHSVIVSHRIAGPLYRFRWVFDKVAQGDLTIRAAIRKRDYLCKEADSINRMLTALNGHVRAVEAESVALAARVGELERVARLEPKEASELIERVSYQLSELTKSLHRIQTSPNKSDGAGEASVEPSVGRDREPQPVATSLQ